MYADANARKRKQSSEKSAINNPSRMGRRMSDTRIKRSDYWVMGKGIAPPKKQGLDPELRQRVEMGAISRRICRCVLDSLWDGLDSAMHCFRLKASLGGRGCAGAVHWHLYSTGRGKRKSRAQLPLRRVKMSRYRRILCLREPGEPMGCGGAATVVGLAWLVAECW